MLFSKVPADAVGADPVAAPEDILPASVIEVPRSIYNTDAAPRVLALAAGGGTSLAVVASIWSAVEQAPEPFLDAPAAPVTIQWLQVGADVTLSEDEVNLAIPALPGKTYIRIESGQGAGLFVLVGWV